MKSFAKNNRETLKQEIIERYLKERQRVPTIRELNKEIEEEVFQEPEILNNGIYIKNKEFPKTKDESSVQKYNSLFKRIKNSILALNSEYDEKRKLIEKEFKNFNKIFTNMYEELEALNDEANLKLLLSNSDAFEFGVIESFRTFVKVDFTKTTAKFLGNRPTVNILKQANVNFENSELSLLVGARSNSIIERSSVNSISKVLKEDGTFFEEIIYTNAPDDIVDFSINLNFRQPRNINKLKLVAKNVEVGSKCAINILYSTDGTIFTPIFESNVRLQNNINMFDVNQTNIVKIKVVLTKRAYDTKRGELYGYIFSVDYIGGTSPEYSINEPSELYLGPYEFLNENKPINFTYATIKSGTCCTIPDKTSIDFYLKKNINDPWLPCGFFDNGSNIVKFNTSEQATIETISLTDSDLVVKSDFGLAADEALLNFYVKEENIEKIDPKVIKIKRLYNNTSRESYDAEDGWYLENELYSCTFYVEENEGRRIDFGFKGTTIINGQSVSGNIFLAKGYHTISTSNYFKITGKANTIDQLRSVDILYPCNAKYLIEGYSYGRSFNEEKVYKGVKENFGWLAKYRSEEIFIDSKNKDIFTSFIKDKDMYFKMKIDTFNNFYDKESIVFDYNNFYSEGNQIYLKAVLKTEDTKVTPKIQSIQIRVI